MDRCRWPNCRNVPALRYLGRDLCWKHWERLCELQDKRRAAHIAQMMALPMATVLQTIDKEGAVGHGGPSLKGTK